MGKPSWVSLILSVVVIGIIVFLAWSATKKTDTENYSKGASHTEVTVAPNEYQLVRCGQLFALDPALMKKETK